MNQSTSSRVAGFRADINGLRAWAVASVVLYHFSIPGVTGGFAGVDLFFVISGYLMAGIVLRGIEAGNFSIIGFYVARARRILPALIAVVFAVLIIGWFLLSPSQYKMLGKHAVSSLFFESNLRYLAEAGYFDAESHTKWLLHTWSLSVEWQFYLVYPLFLVVVARLAKGRRLFSALHVVFLLISAAICIYLTQKSPKKAFYLLHPRTWELLAGGCVFILGRGINLPQQAARLTEAVGIAMIAASVLLVDSDMKWPGILAAAPVAGAALVILAGRGDSVLTGSSIAQWLGDRSYSIYLWHWPLFVGICYFELIQSPWWMAAGIAASLVAGHASYHLIEGPSRKRLSALTNKGAAVWILVCALPVAAAAHIVYQAGGFKARFSEQLRLVDAERKNTNPRERECLKVDAKCTYGGNDTAAVVIGDSHASSLITSVTEALPDARRGIAFRAANGCLYVFGAKRMDGRNDCSSQRDETLRELDTVYKGKPVVLISRTTSYAMGSAVTVINTPKPTVYFTERPESASPEFLAEFRENYISSICKMAKGRDLYQLRPIPEMPVNVPNHMFKRMIFGREAEVAIPIDEYMRRHEYVLALQDEAVRQCGAKVLDLLPYLCDGKSCRGSEDGIPLYYDDNHLSERGGGKLTPLFKTVFERR